MAGRNSAGRAAKKFFPIEIYSNWSYIDKLEGREPVDGEAIEVLWPDGKVRKHKAIYERNTMTVYDHGKGYNAPNYQLFVSVPVYGTEVDIRLAAVKGLKARYDGKV